MATSSEILLMSTTSTPGRSSNATSQESKSKESKVASFNDHLAKETSKPKENWAKQEKLENVNPAPQDNASSHKVKEENTAQQTQHKKTETDETNPAIKEKAHKTSLKPYEENASATPSHHIEPELNDDPIETKQLSENSKKSEDEGANNKSSSITAHNPSVQTTETDKSTSIENKVEPLSPPALTSSQSTQAGHNETSNENKTAPVEQNTPGTENNSVQKKLSPSAEKGNISSDIKPNADQSTTRSDNGIQQNLSQDTEETEITSEETPKDNSTKTKSQTPEQIISGQNSQDNITNTQEEISVDTPTKEINSSSHMAREIADPQSMASQQPLAAAVQTSQQNDTEALRNDRNATKDSHKINALSAHGENKKSAEAQNNNGANTSSQNSSQQSSSQTSNIQSQSSANVQQFSPSKSLFMNELSQTSGTGDGKIIQSTAPQLQSSLISLQEIVPSGNTASMGNIKPSLLPTTPQMVTNQISLAIAKQVGNGQDSFKISLKPAALGQVDIKMDFQIDGKMTATVTVDNERTLNLLQKDQGALEKALETAGFDSKGNNLSFSLNKQHHNNNSSEFAQKSNAEDDSDSIDIMSNDISSIQKMKIAYSDNALDINI